MALVIRTQAPTVELPVVSKDGSGSSNKILVGFKRYDADEGGSRLDEYNNIVQADDFDISKSEELADFIKEEVVYIKDITTETYDESTGKSSKLKISDTRKATKLDGLWESSDQCLAVLLDSYLSFNSWRLPFVSAVQSAIVDMNFEEERLKNS